MDPKKLKQNEDITPASYAEALKIPLCQRQQSDNKPEFKNKTVPLTFNTAEPTAK